LLKHGADVNLHLDTNNHPESTPLLTAVLSKNQTMVKILVERGAYVNNSPALVKSIQSTCLDMARYLLDNGADVNIPDIKGTTPLMAAVQCDLLEMKGKAKAILPLLIEKGANLNSVDCHDRSAAVFAFENNDLVTFSTLMNSPGIDLGKGKSHGKSLISQCLLSSNDDGSLYQGKERFLSVILSSEVKLVSDQDDMVFTVHRSTGLGQYSFLNKLIVSGQFAPSLMTQQSIYCKARNGFVDESVISDFSDVLSPLCMALICDDKIIAEKMIECNFLTMSDLTILPYHEEIKCHLLKNTCELADVISNLGKTPTSLFRLCAVKVSDCIGAKMGRKEKIKQIGLPPMLERTLLYQNNGNELFAGENAEVWKRFRYISDYNNDQYGFTFSGLSMSPEEDEDDS